MELKRFWGEKCSKEQCIYCGKDLNNSNKYKACDWICVDCENKLPYQVNDYVWFPLYDTELDTIKVHYGKILGLCWDRKETYIIEHKNKKDKFVNTKVALKYIDSVLTDCETKCGIKFETSSQKCSLSRDDDLMLMAQQSLLYDMFKNFLKTDLATEANISGISIKISEGYVNAEWKFDKRSKDDIKE